MELHLVIGTWVLAAATIALVGVTWWMLRKQVQLLREQTDDNRKNLCLQNHITFMARFDGQELRSSRVRLARQLLSEAIHDEVVETVMDFFEDVGLFSRRGYLDEDLVWNTFGFYGIRWWAASRDYMLAGRKTQNDPTLFTEFENLVT